MAFRSDHIVASQDLTVNGSTYLFGNLVFNGSTYETHAEQIYTTKDFIIMRDGAISALPDGSLSGLKILIPDGANNVLFGTNNDAVLRIGWENDVLQAIATREDSPANGYYAYWDNASTMFKTSNLKGNIDSSFGLYYPSAYTNSNFFKLAPNYTSMDAILTDSAYSNRYGWTNVGLPSGVGFAGYLTFGTPEDRYGGQILVKYDSPELWFRQINNGASQGWRKVADVSSPVFTSGIGITNNYFEKIVGDVVFATAESNRAYNINLGNLGMWGYIEVEVTSSFNEQSSAGKLTKVFAIGITPNNNIYINESRVVDSMGTIPDNIAIGNMSWDSTNSTYIIPLSHIVSTANTFIVKVRMFSTPATALPVYNALAFSSKYTLTALAKNYVYYNDRVGVGTTSPLSRFEVTAPGTGYWNNSNDWTTQSPPLSTVTISNTTNGGYDSVLLLRQTDSSAVTKNSGAIGVVGKSSWGANNNASQISDMYFAVRNNSGGISERMRLSSDGALTVSSTVTATNFILSSDEKLKMNIVPLQNSPVDIEYKEFELKSEPGQKRYGVIAQELQKTNPELIRADNEGILSVAYIDLLIKEIASLKERVSELERNK